MKSSWSPPKIPHSPPASSPAMHVMPLSISSSRVWRESVSQSWLSSINDFPCSVLDRSKPAAGQVGHHSCRSWTPLPGILWDPVATPASSSHSFCETGKPYLNMHVIYRSLQGLGGRGHPRPSLRTCPGSPLLPPCLPVVSVGDHTSAQAFMAQTLVLRVSVPSLAPCPAPRPQRASLCTALLSQQLLYHIPWLFLPVEENCVFCLVVLSGKPTWKDCGAQPRAHPKLVRAVCTTLCWDRHASCLPGQHG